MERYDWNEFAEAVQSVYGGEVDFEEEYARCPECNDPIFKYDWPNHNFATCPVCEWNIKEDMNDNDPWAKLEEIENEEDWGDEVEEDSDDEIEEDWEEEEEDWDDEVED